MSIPPLILPRATYTDLDHAHRDLLLLVYPSSGCNLIKLKNRSATYFRCASGISIDKSAEPCTLNIAATQSRVDASWSTRIIYPQHNHPKLTTYKPHRGSFLHQLLQEMSAQAGEGTAGAETSYTTTLPVSSSNQHRRRRRASSCSANEVDETPRKRQLPLSPELSGGMNLDLEEEDTKPNMDGGSDVLVLSDSDDDDMGDSLIIFLDSLSSTFKLSKYVDVFRNPEIGVETKEQLIEVCEWDMDGLMDVVGKKMGFAPANAFKKGMEKVMKQKK